MREVKMVMKRIDGIWSLNCPEFAGQLPSCSTGDNAKADDFAIIAAGFVYFYNKIQEVKSWKK